MIFRFLMIIGFVLIIDIYFFQGIKTIISSWPEARRLLAVRIYWGFTLFTFIYGLYLLFLYPSFALPKYFILYTTCLIFVIGISKLIGTIPLLIDDIQRGVRLVAAFFQKGTENVSEGGISRAKFLSYTSLTLAAIPFSTMLYGMVKTAFDFHVKDYRVYLPKLPASFEGLKIVQISDLHLGSFASSESLKRAVKIIMDQKPDLIFFTGDLVNDRALEALPHKDVFKELNAPLGVYSILGNHDYGDYVIWPDEVSKAQNLEELKAIHKEMGWDLLLNTNRVIERNGDKLAIIGVENWGDALRFPKKGDLVQATANLSQIPVKLLLSHDPSHWSAQVIKNYQDIDITFSGHTHGFQFGIDIPGFKWSPSQYVYRQWAGLYVKDNQYINVNRGLGFIGYLGRIGIRPEITVMELTRNNQISSAISEAEIAIV